VLFRSLQQRSYLAHLWNEKMVERSLASTVIIFTLLETNEYLGAGVMIKEDGTTLTAAHVVRFRDGVTQMAATNGNVYNVRILAVDKYRDLALVQPVASAQSFKYSPLQVSNKLSIGQDVLIVGHPYGDFYTVTSGIISRLEYYWWIRCNVIETDAVVNPGNSGGPVFNTEGEIIGIVSALKVDSLGRSLNIGIAVSIYEIHKFLRKYDVTLDKPKQIKRHSLKEFLYVRLATN